MEALDVVLLLVAACAAGWVDAVVGGGGLLQIPALLLAAPQVPVATALGTNKLAGFAGTTVAAVTFARRTPLSPRVVFPAAGLAAAAAAGGALCVSYVPAEALRPIVLVLLLLVALFVALRPDLGSLPRPERATRARRLAAIGLAAPVIGFYDGILGPGTGTFLIISLVTLLGLDFVHSSATAKVINAGTNLGALAVFAAQGHVLWLLGAAMAAANVAGATLGARTAVRRGAGFVRIVLLVVVSALVLRLSYDQWLH